jgi:hypothetical protein
MLRAPRRAALPTKLFPLAAHATRSTHRRCSGAQCGHCDASASAAFRRHRPFDLEWGGFGHRCEHQWRWWGRIRRWQCRRQTVVARRSLQQRRWWRKERRRGSHGHNAAGWRRRRRCRPSSHGVPATVASHLAAAAAASSFTCCLLESDGVLHLGRRVCQGQRGQFT